MEISKLIGCSEYTVGLYDFKLLAKDGSKIDIYARHNTRMAIYEARDYELGRINLKVRPPSLRPSKPPWEAAWRACRSASGRRSARSSRSWR